MNKKELLIYLRGQGFSQKVISAFEKIKREDFVPDEYKKYAYENTPILLTNNETTSQPFTIAFMLDLLELKKGNKVLEIGSGSGYVLSLLHELTKGEIFGIEVVKELFERSRKILKNRKIKIIYGNGIRESDKHAPYDRILVSAAARNDGVIYELAKQLKDNGIIVASVRDKVMKLEKERNKLAQLDFPGFLFVPLRD